MTETERILPDVTYRRNKMQTHKITYIHTHKKKELEGDACLQQIAESVKY